MDDHYGIPRSRGTRFPKSKTTEAHHHNYFCHAQFLSSLGHLGTNTPHDNNPQTNKSQNKTGMQTNTENISSLIHLPSITLESPAIVAAARD
ncbi:hypothetical protein RJT34_12381 [Clitoria ternatea]|uniref:Uncharacterized protein n=1 Tax=Clitoria ternatea TaxID=43366 RepID=A0AAN9JLL6_CLITE